MLEKKLYMKYFFKDGSISIQKVFDSVEHKKSEKKTVKKIIINTNTFIEMHLADI